MEIIYGINPLTEALRVDPCRILRIAIAGEAKTLPLQRILHFAAGKSIPVSFKGKNDIDKLVGHGSHQGVVGFCESFRYADLDQLLANRHQEFSKHLILLLDGITDPQNLGALIRTAHCHGVNGVIIPAHRAAPVTGTVIKASAGAALLTPVVLVVNLSKAIDELKKRGFWIYGADTESGRKVSAMAYEGHVGLVMGSEGRGMRALIRGQCDMLVSIPLMGKIDSLNVSVAAGIILNDIVRKWTGAEGAE